MPTLERQEVSAPSWETCLRLPFLVVALEIPLLVVSLLPLRYFQTPFPIPRCSHQLHIHTNGRSPCRSNRGKSEPSAEMYAVKPALGAAVEIISLYFAVSSNRKSANCLLAAPSATSHVRSTKLWVVFCGCEPRRGVTDDNLEYTPAFYAKATGSEKAVADGTAYAFGEWSRQARRHRTSLF